MDSLAPLPALDLIAPELRAFVPEEVLPLYRMFQDWCYDYNVQKDNSSLLHWATRKGNNTMMNTLLDEFNADVNTIKDGQTPLIAAVYSRFASGVEKLLSMPSLDLERGNQGRIALWRSVTGNDMQIMTLLCCHPKINMNMFFPDNEEGVTLLMNRVIHNNVKMATLLLDHPTTDPNLRQPGQLTPLLCALNRGYLPIVNLLLSSDRLDPSCTDQKGMTALHYAASKGHIHVVRALLHDFRVDVNTQSQQGSTALHLAVKHDQQSMVNYLICQGIDLNRPDQKGRTALFVSIHSGNELIAFRLLEEKNLQVNTLGEQETNYYWTPLHQAVCQQKVSLVNRLLAYPGLDPNIPDSHGRTAFWWAAFEGSRRMIWSLLRDQRVDRTVKDRDKAGAIDAAKDQGHRQVVCLLALGATGML